MRIATRLQLSVTASIMSVLLLNGLWALRLHEMMLREGMARETSTLSQALYAVSDEALRDGTPESLHRVLGTVVADRATLAAAVLDSAGAVVLGGADREFDCLRGVLPRSPEPSAAGWSECGERIRWVAMPLSGGANTLLVARRVGIIDQVLLATARRHMLLALTLTAVATLAIASVLHSALSEPLRQLVDGTRRLGGGEWVRIALQRPASELRQLADAFNQMAERMEAHQQRQKRDAETQLRLERELHEQEHFAAIGRLSGGIAHEIASPLNVIRLRAESAAAGGLPVAAARHLHEIIAEVDRTAHLMRALLLTARRHTIQREELDLTEVAARVVAEIGAEAEDAGIALQTTWPEGPVLVHGDPMLLQHALVNLARNAIQAMRNAPQPRVLAIRIEAEAGSRALRVVLEDTGPGIAAEDLGRIFDPFFTRKPFGDGTGLGLTISRGIIEQHGGALRLETHATGGVRAEVTLAAAPESASLPVSP
jgi:signal transduction histidine kinase